MFTSFSFIYFSFCHFCSYNYAPNVKYSQFQIWILHCRRFTSCVQNDVFLLWKSGISVVAAWPVMCVTKLNVCLKRIFLSVSNFWVDVLWSSGDRKRLQLPLLFQFHPQHVCGSSVLIKLTKLRRPSHGEIKVISVLLNTVYGARLER